MQEEEMLENSICHSKIELADSINRNHLKKNPVHSSILKPEYKPSRPLPMNILF
jgi:hypothetical protein